MAAGYSGTPLARKLGIRDGDRVAVLADPGRALDLLAPLPEGVRLLRKPGRADVVLFFTTRRSELERRIPRLGDAVFPAGSCWISWPKRSSNVPTDVTEDVVREVALPLGLVDTKVCAIDETWSGLRLVWRKELRRAPAP
jgi:hypothetical protein